MPTNTKEAGDQNLHVSFPVLCTDLKIVDSNLCTARRPIKESLGGSRTENN